MRVPTHVWTCAAALLVVSGRAASAQTKFVIRDSTVRFAKYTTVEECLALAYRLQAQYAVRRDTMRYARPRAASLNPSPYATPESQPHPAIVSDWSRKCMAKFRADTAPVDTTIQLRSPMVYWESAYLLAHDLASARTIRDRQLAVVPDTTVSAAMKARREMYANLVRPLDLDLLDEADSIALAKLKTLGRNIPPFFATVGLLHDRSQRRWDLGQRAVARARAQDLLAYVKNFNLTESERAGFEMVETYGLVEIQRLAIQKVRYDLLLDSLRLAGPDAYERMKLRMWNDAGGGPEIFKPIVGRPARPIVASFVVPRDTSGSAIFKAPAAGVDSSIPLANKVTLLVFLRNACREESAAPGYLERNLFGGQCWETYGTIRRLAQRFPSLDITIVTQTMGVVGPQLANDPAEEARLIQSLWHGYHRLPANIAIVPTPHLRVESPDNRRDDRPADYAKYYFGRDFFLFMAPEPRQNAYLIGPGRRVLEYEHFWENGEARLQEVLAPLMEWYDKQYSK